MARRTKIVQITDEGRDFGKTFLITEMSAAQVERWAMRVFQALARGNVDIGDVSPDTGLAGIARMGLKAIAKMEEENLLLLMAEMFSCISILPNPQNYNVQRPVTEDDIEEVGTRLKLRMEVFELHTGFSLAGGNQSTEALQPASPSSLSSTLISPALSGQ